MGKKQLKPTFGEGRKDAAWSGCIPSAPGAAHASPKRKTKMVGPCSGEGRQCLCQEDIEVEAGRMKTVLQPMKRGQDTVEIDCGEGIEAEWRAPVKQQSRKVSEVQLYA